MTKSREALQKRDVVDALIASSFIGQVRLDLYGGNQVQRLDTGKELASLSWP